GRRDQTLINASAIGYYGSRGDEVLSEASAPGSGFLSDVTSAWEASAASAADVARVVILRFGIVLAGDGGALPEMARPFSWLVGGPLGSGRQWLSWIDRGDLIRLVQWVISNQRAAGVYNATSPNPVRNDDFTRTLASVLHRPALFRVPAFALRRVLGREKAEALLLFSDRVVPRRAIDEGFEFLFSDLRVSLERAFGRSD
ncbi:MAG: TIGR01777 family oxidoreductase, partial [Acidobacteriota bacterium]